MHSDPTPVRTHTYRTFTPTSPRPNTRDYDVISKIEAQKQSTSLQSILSGIHALISPLIGLRACLCDRKRLILGPERGRNAKHEFKL